MDWRYCVAGSLRDGFLQEMGRTFVCVSVPEHRRQCAVGRKHNFLWRISFYVRERNLGSDSDFHNSHQETNFFSLGPRRYIIGL